MYLFKKDDNVDYNMNNSSKNMTSIIANMFSFKITNASKIKSKHTEIIKFQNAR